MGWGERGRAPVMRYEGIYRHMFALRGYIPPHIRATRVYTATYSRYEGMYRHIFALRGYIPPHIRATGVYTATYSRYGGIYHHIGDARRA